MERFVGRKSDVSCQELSEAIVMLVWFDELEFDAVTFENAPALCDDEGEVVGVEKPFDGKFDFHTFIPCVRCLTLRAMSPFQMALTTLIMSGR